MRETYPYYIEGLAERLKKFFGVETGQQLAEILEENNGKFNHYLTGRNKITYILLMKIYEAGKRKNKGHINLAWLLTGELPERIEDFDQLNSSRNQDPDTDLLNDLRGGFLLLDTETRSTFRPTLDVLKREFHRRIAEQKEKQYPHAASPGVIKEEKLSKQKKRAIKKDVRDALRAVSEDEERENQK